MGRYSSYQGKYKKKEDKVKETKSTIVQSIKEGIGLGVGVTIANQIVGRIFDGVLGGRKIEIENKADRCMKEKFNLEKCVKGLEYENCNIEFEAYNKCLNT